MQKMNIDPQKIPWGKSLVRKSVRDFFRTKRFLQKFDGFSLKTRGFLPKAYVISSEGNALRSADAPRKMQRR